MYALTGGNPFRQPVPHVKTRHRVPPEPDLLAKVPPLRTLADVDAWVEACKLPSKRAPGVLTEEQWRERVATRPVDVDTEFDSWKQRPGGIRRPQ